MPRLANGTRITLENTPLGSLRVALQGRSGTIRGRLSDCVYRVELDEPAYNRTSWTVNTRYIRVENEVDFGPGVRVAIHQPSGVRTTFYNTTGVILERAGSTTWRVLHDTPVEGRTEWMHSERNLHIESIDKYWLGRT